MYNGRVTVGGPADVHELGALVVSKLAVGPFDNNAYLLRCRTTGDQVLIDAAAEPERLLDLVGPDGLTMIVTTHRHPDHWQALADVATATGAPTAAHVDDAAGIHLTESYAMLPAASVSGLYFSHPQARYFAVDLVTRDQVEAYAARKGLPLKEVERWLAPNLAYEAE